MMMGRKIGNPIVHATIWFRPGQGGWERGQKSARKSMGEYNTHSLTHTCWKEYG